MRLGRQTSRIDASPPNREKCGRAEARRPSCCAPNDVVAEFCDTQQDRWTRHLLARYAFRILHLVARICGANRISEKSSEWRFPHTYSAKRFRAQAANRVLSHSTGKRPPRAGPSYPSIPPARRLQDWAPGQARVAVL